jgi:hypothetical protein
MKSRIDFISNVLNQKLARPSEVILFVIPAKAGIQG